MTVEPITDEQRFDWPHSFIIEYCNETPKTLDQIRRAVADHPSASTFKRSAETSIDTAVSTLVAQRLLVEDRGRHFTLALPANPHL